MTLRRTGIARKTEMRRTAVKRERAVAPRARRRDTGPTPAQRTLVAERAGYCCELCGDRLHDGDAWSAPHSFHHRQPRGMGGSRLDTANAAYQLLLTCGTGTTGCHGFIESHRSMSEAEGWLVRHGFDPAVVPVTVDRCAGPVLLTADGDYQPATEEAR